MARMRINGIDVEMTVSELLEYSTALQERTVQWGPQAGMPVQFPKPETTLPQPAPSPPVPTSSGRYSPVPNSKKRVVELQKMGYTNVTKIAAGVRLAARFPDDYSEIVENIDPDDWYDYMSTRKDDELEMLNASGRILGVICRMGLVKGDASMFLRSISSEIWIAIMCKRRDYNLTLAQMRHTYTRVCGLATDDTVCEAVLRAHLRTANDREMFGDVVETVELVNSGIMYELREAWMPVPPPVPTRPPTADELTGRNR